MDDPVEEKSDLRSALKGMSVDYPSILLAHSPKIFEEASANGMDLLLAGHNHGGQIFVTKILRKIFPLNPALEFLEGFFQKGKELMYVNRGIGTSYLPFRLGVKPEITFFKFTNETNEKIRMSRIDSTDPINSKNSINSSYPTNTSNPNNPLLISNTTPTIIFTGFNFSNLIETFNILKIFDSLHLPTIQKRQETSINSNNPMNSINPTNPNDPTNSSNPKILFDFESESDLKRLNWECHKWFELSKENATSGQHSLRVILPPGQYPGINMEGIGKDWSESNYFKMDIFNPGEAGLKLHIRIDDNKSSWEYADRFDINFDLKPGLNQLSIPTDSIKTNIHHRPLNLKKIKRMIVFIPNNLQKREIYIDNIRLE